MKIDIAIRKGIIATHVDVEFLRKCAEALRANPDQVIELVTSGDPVRNRFLMMTLIHFGVSCGRIRVV